MKQIYFLPVKLFSNSRCKLKMLQLKQYNLKFECKYANAVIKFFYFIINENLAIGKNVFHYSILKFPNSLNIFREFFSASKSNPYLSAGDSLMSLKAIKLIVLSIISLVIKAVIEIVSLKVNPN